MKNKKNTLKGTVNLGAHKEMLPEKLDKTPVVFERGIIDGITGELDRLFLDLNDLSGQGASINDIKKMRDTVKRLRARIIMAENHTHGD